MMNAKYHAEDNKMKNCKYCLSEINKKAKVCPVCGKSQESFVIKFILILIIIMMLSSMFTFYIRPVFIRIT